MLHKNTGDHFVSDMLLYSFILYLTAYSVVVTVNSGVDTEEGQGPWPPRSPRPKFAIAKVCRIQILHRAKNTKYYVQMCKKLQLVGDFVLQTLYQSLAPGPHWGLLIPQLP